MNIKMKVTDEKKWKEIGYAKLYMEFCTLPIEWKWNHSWLVISKPNLLKILLWTYQTKCVEHNGVWKF